MPTNFLPKRQRRIRQFESLKGTRDVDGRRWQPQDKHAMVLEMPLPDRGDPVQSEVGFGGLHRPTSIRQGLCAMEAVLNRAILEMTKLALTVNDAPAGN